MAEPDIIVERNYQGNTLWVAHYKGDERDEDGWRAVGFGETKEQAIEDLKAEYPRSV